MACPYQQTRGKRRFHFSPARRRVDAPWRSALRPTAWSAFLRHPRKRLRPGERSSGLTLKDGIGGTTAGATASSTVKTGSSRLNGSAAGVRSRTASRAGSGSSPTGVSAHIGSTLGLVLRAPCTARRRAARSSRSWRSRSSARVSPKRSGRTRPVSRCTSPASAGALGGTASAAGRSEVGSGARIAGPPPPGRVGGLTGTERAPNSSWSARRCRSLKELSAVVTVRGTRLLVRFTSTVNDGLAR